MVTQYQASETALLAANRVADEAMGVLADVQDKAACSPICVN
jgi:hypothetical protein